MSALLESTSFATVLDPFEFDDAARARVQTAIERCLEPLQRSTWPAVAWKFSSLNADGDPLEFAFSTLDRKLRMTVEAAGPECDTHARLEAAIALCASFGQRVPEDTFASWRALQRGAHLRWGAWFGLRADANGIRVKLYLELPASARERAVNTGVARLTRDGELIMLGYDCAADMTEYYYRQPALRERHLADDFTRHFTSDAGRGVLEDFVRLTCRPLRFGLAWTDFGYSVAARPDGSRAALSLFVRSSSLPDRGVIRDRFLALDRNLDSVYARRFANVPAHELPDHGTVSLIAYDDGGRELRAGIGSKHMRSQP